MLRSAKGPFAELFISLSGDDLHRWDELMAQPQAAPLYDKQFEAQWKSWEGAVRKLQSEAAKEKARVQKIRDAQAKAQQKKAEEAQAEKEAAEESTGKEAADTEDSGSEKKTGNEDSEQKETAPEIVEVDRKITQFEIKLPPEAPYEDWAKQTFADWDRLTKEVIAKGQLDDQQKQQASDIFYTWKSALADYLVGEYKDMTTYRHDLFRLAEKENAPTGSGVPYESDRIAKLQAKARAQAARWKSEIRDLESQFALSLRDILEEGKQRIVDDEITGLQGKTKVDHVVTYLTLGVGALLILGLFTRLASLVGAGFLLSVILTQPPWVADAAPVYYQSVEMFALLVLVGTAAGRWAGLDFFFSGCCGKKNAAQESQS